MDESSSMKPAETEEGGMGSQLGILASLASEYYFLSRAMSGFHHAKRCVFIEIPFIATFSGWQLAGFQTRSILKH